MNNISASTSLLNVKNWTPAVEVSVCGRRLYANYHAVVVKMNFKGYSEHDKPWYA